jgi:hypothetical protein
MVGLALDKGIGSSSLRRTLRLKLLSPKIIKAITDDGLPEGDGLAEIVRSLPAEWGCLVIRSVSETIDLEAEKKLLNHLLLAMYYGLSGFAMFLDESREICSLHILFNHVMG